MCSPAEWSAPATVCPSLAEMRRPSNSNSTAAILSEITNDERPMTKKSGNRKRRSLAVSRFIRHSSVRTASSPGPDSSAYLFARGTTACTRSGDTTTRSVRRQHWGDCRDTPPIAARSVHRQDAPAAARHNGTPTPDARRSWDSRFGRTSALHDQFCDWISPGGAADRSPGRKAGVECRDNDLSHEVATEDFCRTFGAWVTCRNQSPGLTAGATFCRRSAAKFFHLPRYSNVKYRPTS